MNPQVLVPPRDTLPQRRTPVARKACTFSLSILALLVLTASTAAQPSPKIDALHQQDGGVIAIDVTGSSSTDQVTLGVEQSRAVGSVDQSWSEVPVLSQQRSGDGMFRVTIPDPESNAAFFRIRSDLTPQARMLVGNNQVGGFMRTGHHVGPEPPGGRGDILTGDPGFTRELLWFTRGVIPGAAAGGPKYTDIDVLVDSFKFEHAQDIEPIGDWSRGAAYFAVSHSQHYFGHLFILKTTQQANPPNQHEVWGLARKVNRQADGEGVWYQRYDLEAEEGIYNHPGDLASVGDVLLVAAQNWAGGEQFGISFPLHRYGNGPADRGPDAILFYDVSNPEAPTYLGKIKVSAFGQPEISDLTAFQMGDYYYLVVNGGLWLRSRTMSLNPQDWAPVSVEFRQGAKGRDGVIPVRMDNGGVAYWAFKGGTDDYWVSPVTTSGDTVVVGPGHLTYDVDEIDIAASQAEHGFYISPRGRMTKITGEAGFSTGGNDVYIIESHSIHYGLGTAKPAVISRGAGQMDCFVTDGRALGLWHIRLDEEQWNGWEDLGGLLVGEPGGAAWGPDRLDVFARAVDNQLWHNGWGGVRWGGWESLGGTLLGSPAVVSRGPNRLDVFSRNADSALWHKGWDGAGWSTWMSLGGVLAGDPVVVSRGADRLDVFSRHADSALWHRGWDGTQWSEWMRLGGQFSGDPAVVAWGPDRLDVFARAVDNQLWHNGWDGVVWGGWESLGGALLGAPAVVSRGPNQLDVFSRHADGALWHRGWDGIEWSEWMSLGGQLHGDPTAVSWGAGHIAVFARAVDDHIWFRQWDGEQWHGWAHLPFHGGD